MAGGGYSGGWRLRGAANLDLGRKGPSSTKQGDSLGQGFVATLRSGGDVGVGGFHSGELPRVV